MREAAPAPRRTLVFAFAAVLAIASLASAAAPHAAVHSGARASATLPASLWGVEVGARSARTLTARRLVELRAAGINVLVAPPSQVRGKTLARLRRLAARARVLVVAPRLVRRKGIRATNAARTMCRRAGRCALMASSPSAAPRLSRTTGVDLVVVRVSGPRQASRLRRTAARRLLAITPLVPSPVKDAAVWRSAIASARGSAALDVAVRASTGPALDAYLALLKEAGAKPKPTPTPPPPPSPAPPPAPAPPPPPGGSGGVPVYTKENPPATPTLAQLPKLASVTKDGVTWTFSEAESVGQFITGDYYVVGNATVTAISPAPANGRNGSVKNIPPDDSDTGFDSRTDANRYKASLAVALPVDLVPGDSLVSSISVDTVGQLRRWLFDKAAGSPVRSALDPDERPGAAASRRLPALLRRQGGSDQLLAEPSARPAAEARSGRGSAVARRVGAALPPPLGGQSLLQLRQPGRVHAGLLARDRPRGRHRGAPPVAQLHGRAEGAAARLPDPVRHRPLRPREGGPPRLVGTRRPRKRAQVPDRLRRHDARAPGHAEPARASSARTCRR